MPPRSKEADIVSPYLAQLVKDWLAEDTSRSQAALARAAGVSGAQVSNLLDGSRGAGRKTLRGIASALGTTWPDVEREAADWASKHPEAARPRYVVSVESPGEEGPFDAAARFARANNVPEWAIERVRARPARLARERTAEDYWSMIKAEHLAGEDAGGRQEVGRPADDDELAAPRIATRRRS